MNRQLIIEAEAPQEFDVASMAPARSVTVFQSRIEDTEPFRLGQDPEEQAQREERNRIHYQRCGGGRRVLRKRIGE